LGGYIQTDEGVSTMSRSLTAFALVVLAVLATGCVSESQYRQLEQAYRNTLEQVAERDARIAELETQIEALRSGPLRDRDTIAALTDENNKLRERLDELQRELERLGQAPSVVILNPETDRALKEFAARHPDLIEYDPARGMVKFRSDLTFALGSADLTSNARSTLSQFAAILNDPATSQYEVRIIGHTDSVPISRGATAAKHPTNWHLSAHRAISVRDALQTAGVSPVRTMIGGYGMFRPVVQNSRGGAEPNRRVEIYLVGMTPVNEAYLDGAGSPRPTPRTPAPAPAAPEAGVDDRIPQK
jgi:chemotaxis protein MotB